MGPHNPQMSFQHGPRWLQKTQDDDKCTPKADAVAKRYRPWPKGLRADSLPWFDSPLVQGASRLRYTDKAQMQRPGHTGRKALATKKMTNAPQKKSRKFPKKNVLCETFDVAFFVNCRCQVQGWKQEVSSKAVVADIDVNVMSSSLYVALISPFWLPKWPNITPL